MFLICLLATVVSSFCIGFGAVSVNKTGVRKIWGVYIDPGKKILRFGFIGVLLLVFGFGVLLLSAAVLCFTWSVKAAMFGLLSIFLGWIFVVTGSVAGDFVSLRYTDYPEESLSKLHDLQIIKKADSKMKNSYGVLVKIDGLVFLEKDGSELQTLLFKDFEVAELKRSVERNILCQYFASRHPEKEVHCISDKI